jgi:putative SOS response-associated peptidase YedK
MCGRYTSTSTADEIAGLLQVDLVVADDLGPRYNVAPTQDVYAVAEHDGERRLGLLRWGLVPPWADDPSVGSRMINARAESLAESRAFRPAFARRRCLVPADGFYEWRPVPGRRAKQPYLIRRRDGRPLVFAGLWERWRPRTEDGPRLATCTIITTEANTTVGRVHDRMPALLPPEAWDRWLDPEAGEDDLDRLRALLVPAPDDELELIPVGTLVSDVRNEGPELVEPVPEPEEEPGTPTLFDDAG